MDMEVDAKAWSMGLDPPDLVERRKRKENPEAATATPSKRPEDENYTAAQRKAQQIVDEREREETTNGLWERAKRMDDDFKEFTKDGKYMKLHWHMEVDEQTKVEDDDQPPVNEDEDEIGWFHMHFGYHPRLWEIRHYGNVLGIQPNTFQVYKIKLTHNSNVYPLVVYGQMRLYCERSMPELIFDMDRDHPQTITEKDPYLLLTGPLCPPFFLPPRSLAFIEARLILKGNTQSDDKYLAPSNVGVNYDDHLLCSDDVSKCCEEGILPASSKYLLELTQGVVIHSVAANISLELLDPSISRQDSELKGYYFTAYISDKEEVVLLDSRDAKGAAELDDDSKFKLSRRIICVENNKCLTVRVQHDEIREDVPFPPAAEGKEEVKTVHLGSCKIKVKVKWSNYEEVFVLSETMKEDTCYPK